MELAEPSDVNWGSSVAENCGEFPALTNTGSAARNDECSLVNSRDPTTRVVHTQVPYLSRFLLIWTRALCQSAGWLK